MRKLIFTAAALGLLAAVAGTACKPKKPSPQPSPDYGKFPDAVGKILVSKCATSGCHNAASYQNAAGLQLDTWEHLFLGSGNGAVVVPYNADYSPLLYFVNTNAARGTVATPTMPYNNPPLSDAEYNTLKEWIANGAPDKDGNIAFAADEDTRQKIYLTQQGCDLVAVIDAKSELVMRYIGVGTSNGDRKSVV